ncbi:transcriptional repressor [Candidatus Woesearchaeota archaeon]|nr:transcriptional repressor [Candidatus Woesearchaeota archaeon]MCF7901527.1 transcriptional repressor [Candidatus Woesearchaeota archaeon]MCF8013871.1 transcriptional repressor [Candidatus Woesearchaeota archaeon]
MTLKRKTKQKEIIEEQISKIKTFFSAEELYEIIKQKYPEIGIATIYRHLKEKEKGKTLFSYLCERRKIYSTEKKSHCHFICETTGKTIHFDLDNIDFIKNKVPGKISSIQIEIKGICNDCKNA